MLLPQTGRSKATLLGSTEGFRSRKLRMLQVVTAARTWQEQRSDQIGAGFDQEAAMVMLARLTIFKYGSDVPCWWCLP